MHIRLVALMLLVTLLAVAGCQKNDVAPPPPTPAPAPEQIAGQIRSSLAPLQAPLTGAGPFDANLKESVLTALRTARSQNQITPNGKIALNQVTNDIQDIIRQAREQKRWPLVVAALEAYEIFQPNDPQMATLKKLADLEVKKPKVTLKGWWTDKEANEQVYAFLTLLDPVTKAQKEVRVREGEEFDNLKFIRIIGNLSGVLLEYLPIPGELFEVRMTQ
jgi:hypothetical protein